MYWCSILACGAGCDTIIARASIVLGPHSLECGLNVGVRQGIHVAVRGANASSVWDKISCFIEDSVRGLFRSSA